MPTIPGYEQSKNILPEAPPAIDISAERAGQDSAVLGQIGGQVASIGNKLIQARKEAEESDAVSKAQSDDTLWLAGESSKLRLEYNRKQVSDEDSDLVPFDNSIKKSSEVPLDPNIPEGSRGPAAVDGRADNQQEVLSGISTAEYDVTGFADELRKRMEDRVKQNIEKMPTGDAQRAYIARVQPMMDRTYASSLDWENQTRAQTYLNNLSVRSNIAAQYLENAPSLDTATNLLDAMRNDLNSKIGNVVSADDAQKLYRTYARQYVMALFDGYGNNEKTAAEGINLLNSISELAPRSTETGELLTKQKEQGPLRKIEFGPGADPTGIQSVLLPGDISNMRDKLERVQGEGVRQKVGDVKARMRDYEEVLSNPDPGVLAKYFNDDKVRENLLFMQNAAKMKNSGVTQDEADRLNLLVAFGKSVAQVRNQLYLMSPSEKGHYDKMLDQEFNAQLKLVEQDDPAFAFGTKEKYNELKDKLWNGIVGQREKDPAAYVESFMGKNLRPLGGNVPSQTRLDWRAKSMAQLGIQNQSLLTAQEKQSFQKRLKEYSDTSPDQAAAYLSSIRNNSGRYANRVFEELNTGKGKLDDFFRTASYMQDDSASAAVIGNTKNKKALEDGFDERFGKEGLKTLNESLSSSFKKNYDAFASTGSYAKNVGFANSLQQQVRLEAMRSMLTDGIDQDAALSEAQKKIVDNHYAVVGGTFVQRRIGDVEVNLNYIQGEMQKVHDNGWLSKQGLVLPGGKDSPENRKKVLENALSTGKWVTAPNGLGATYFVKDSHGRWFPPLKKDGKPLSIDYAESSINPSQEAQDYNKSFIDKFIKPDDRKPQSVPNEDGGDFRDLEGVESGKRITEQEFAGLEALKATYGMNSKEMQKELDRYRKGKK